MAVWLPALLTLSVLSASHGLLPPPQDPQAFTLLPPYLHEEGALCDVDSGCLSLTSTMCVSGEDGVGAFTGEEQTWTTAQGTQMVTLVKLYEDSDVSVYETAFPDGLTGCDVGDKDKVCTGFPVLRLVNASADLEFRYVTPGNKMLGWTRYSQGRYGEEGGIAGFIIPDLYAVVLSSLDRPMAVNNWLDVQGGAASLHYGVEGLAGAIPAGFSVSVIATTQLQQPSRNASFVSAVMKWGENVQKTFGVTKMEDPSTEYLGFWTDNGAFYYYNTDTNDNYEELLIDLYNYTQAHDIPVRYLQLDSWWYYKGLAGGVKNWTAMPSVFPSGLEALHAQVPWPFLAHNRYFSSDTDYASDNGGQYPFFLDNNSSRAVPLDKSFWDDLFDEALGWGLAVYEQDWLDEEYEYVSTLHSNITLGDDWLHNMASAAEERGVRVQYCMSLPREAMHGAAENAVTHIRVSEDYSSFPNQWEIGHTSLFAHALGLKPFKDVFSTSNINFYDASCTSSTASFVNVSESGAPCVHWSSINYDALYPGEALEQNFCSNPRLSKDRDYCFTKASVDIPVHEWAWDYCSTEACRADCYRAAGHDYLGTQAVTEQGYSCVDWSGKFGLTGSFCRNPKGTEGRPWCYINDDFSAIDFCENACAQGVELSPSLQSAVATLSTGPVGIGDKMEKINRTLVLKSCRSDGRLLQPSKPLTAIDLFFLSDSKPKIWTAESTISSQYTFGLIFIAEVAQEHVLSPSELNLEESLSVPTVVWQHYPYDEAFTRYPANSSITTPPDRFFLNFGILATSPVFDVLGDEYAILGEVEKWTPVSRDRVTSIEADGESLLVTIEGGDMEVVTMLFYLTTEGVFEVECAFENSSGTGHLVIDVPARGCNPPEDV